MIFFLVGGGIQDDTLVKYKTKIERPLTKLLSFCYRGASADLSMLKPSLLDLMKLILTYKPNISMKFITIDFAFINLRIKVDEYGSAEER